MYAPRHSLKIVSLVVLWLCVVVSFAKNVENVRSKRTTNNNHGLEQQNSCESVKPFFLMKNITLSPPDTPKGNICGGQCCGDKTEEQLRKQGQRDFAGLLRHNSRSLQGLLSSTAATLQNHVSELARQSENKTLFVFSQVYREMSVLSKHPIATLYEDIRNYIQINATTAGEFASTTLDLKASVARFFTDLFPLVYHQVNKMSNKDFAPDYKACLKKTIDTILPFGETPAQLAQSLSKSMEATRLLLQAFNIGTIVLNTTDTLLIDSNSAHNLECHNALLKMTYCPKCQGLTKNTRPCEGYCLNVLRGCITKYVAELDLPWNGYVEGIENLVNAMKKSNSNEAGVNADAVIRNLDTQISNAIMHTMVKAKDISMKVQRSCGAAVFSETTNPLFVENSTPLPSGNSSTLPTGKFQRIGSPRLFSPLPETQLVHFLTSIGKTKGFYGNLANTLCHDDSFAEPSNKHCWNGERIGEYTKTVVEVTMNMQKYNPEVKPSTNEQNAVDSHVADLVDKLRHVHHMALTSLGPSYGDADYMQRDGVEGSGSGGGPDGDEDDEYARGSGGSGDRPDEPRIDISTSRTPSISSPNSPTNKVQTQGCSSVTPSTLLISMVLLIFTIISSYHPTN